MNISTSAYDAEFGGAGGAITNVTLKSGTNTFKGSVFAFGNNEKTNAPGAFHAHGAPAIYLQSGFTLGGPLWRNTLFFFGDYQHINDNAGRTTRARSFHRRHRTGDFSASPTRIYDPATATPTGRAARRSRTTSSRPTGSARLRRRSSPTCRRRTSPRRPGQPNSRSITRG